MKLHSALWAYRVAYKTTVGTTTFNLTFGMNVVLPMDFVIPTLWVAKKLEWMGHELCDKIDDFEKLNKTKLSAMQWLTCMLKIE